MNLAALPQGGYQTPTPDSGAAVGPSTAPHGASGGHLLRFPGTPEETPDTITLPEGRTAPADLLGLLGRADMVSWLTVAGVLETRELLMVPAEELRFLPRLGTRARLIEARLRDLGIEPGCLAPAPTTPAKSGRVDPMSLLDLSWMNEGKNHG